MSLNVFYHTLYIASPHSGCAHSGSNTVSVSIVSEGLRKTHEREKDSSLSGSIVESIYAGHVYFGKQVLIVWVKEELVKGFLSFNYLAKANLLN